MMAGYGYPTHYSYGSSGVGFPSDGFTPVIDTISGGDSASALTDIIDGGDSTSAYADNIDGGSA